MNPLCKEYDNIYSKKDYYRVHYDSSPYRRLWKKVAEDINSTESVVELGCGTGQLMQLLQEKGIPGYIGYDFSEVGIDLARERIKNPNFSVFNEDLYEMNSLPSADVYVAVEVLEHLVEDIKVISLIPSGKKVIITVPNYLGGSHVRKFDTEDQVIDRYFKVIDCTKISFIGSGNLKVFVMVGRKL